MVLIVAQKKDITTNQVCEWLLSKRIKFKRLNSEQVLNRFSFYLSDNDSETAINNSVPEKIWHRRGKFCIYPKGKFSTSINNYLKEEADGVIKSVELHLKKKIDYTGSFLKEKENYKLFQLEIARECGFKIPNTLVTTFKQELMRFVKNNKLCITKDIRYPVRVHHEGKLLLSTGVKVVTNKMINSLEDIFAPVLIQKQIIKLYEVRIFFHKKRIYPMAIFSQKKPKTKVDFRNYDENIPNRCVPVKLPFKELNKLKCFIKKYGIDTGSIDLICTPKNDYVFLEINSQGQLDCRANSYF